MSPTHRLIEKRDAAFEGSYFVSTYPPFSTWGRSELGEVDGVLAREALGAGKPIGLYVHIPFCLKKCDYCFYLSRSGAGPDAVDEYVHALESEISEYRDSAYMKDRELSFVYFGGGTPSVLTPGQILLLGGISRHRIPWRRDCEVTFECSPKTVSESKVAALKSIGVNRVSMGVQSFDNELLRLNGRLHLQSDILRAYGLLRQGDFPCVNLDLMAGLPGESWSQWGETVQRVQELAPESITVYQTEMPLNTKLYRDFKESCLVAEPVSWEVKRERVQYAFERFEAVGYTVVNGYAAVRDPERHRFVYQDLVWKGEDMLGIGVSSYSYIDGVHFQNIPDLPRYLEQTRRGEPTRYRALRLSREEKLIREFILQLKTGTVYREEFRARFGEDILDRFSRELQELEEGGWLRRLPTHVALTRPGLLGVDALIPLFYLREHGDIRYS